MGDNMKVYGESPLEGFYREFCKEEEIIPSVKTEWIKADRPSIDPCKDDVKKSVSGEFAEYSYQSLLLFTEQLTLSACLGVRSIFKEIAGRECYFYMFESMAEEVEC